MAIVDSMIQVLVEQVFTGLQKKADIALDFWDQFEVMKTKLDLTKALLSDTEGLKCKKDSLKTTLSKFRELIYEADNILTDCLVRDEYQKDGSCFSTFALQEPLFRYQTCKKLKEINSKMETMKSDLSTCLEAQDSSTHSDNSHQVVKYTSQDIDPSEIIGLKMDLEKLKGWIIGTTNVLHRIGIVGMGGLGKTTIAQMTFNDKEVVEHFDKMLWISVSQTWSEEKIMRSILEQLDISFKISDEGQLLTKIGQVLKDQTCLIVMDDVWRMNLPWWNNFCSNLQKVIGKSSCVVITTRNEEVAMDMGADKSQIHQPKTLDSGESWLLFSNTAFLECERKCNLDVQFVKVGREILDKCGGLPLAIKTVAGLLKRKKKSPAQWIETNKNFHELMKEEKISPVMASLQMSYDELPSHLKQCLLSFSIYPEDSEIQAEHLIHWWVGEGLIQGKGSKTAQEMGFEYLSDLVTRCLVEAVRRRDYDGRVYSCRMHDMVRELTIKLAEEESFGFFDEQGRQKLTADTRWLGFTSSMNSKSLKSSSKLRALLLMPSDHVVLGKHIKLLKSLRVLDFSVNKQQDKVSVDDLLVQVCSLRRLAYLNLSGSSGLKELPSSLRKLRNLQLLILSGCNNLSKLNQSITTLKKLVILDLGSTSLPYLPAGIERLVHLQELSGFKVGSQTNKQSCQFCELQELKNLRILRMNIGKDSKISESEMKVLSHLAKLKVLAIDTEDCEDSSILEMLNGVSPPPSLQEFYLRNYKHETLPTWINPEELSVLQYLCIENGELTHIQIDDGESFPTWNIEGLCFKVLPRLKLDWNNLKKEMPFLCYAEVSGCHNLENFPEADHGKLAVWRKKED